MSKWRSPSLRDLGQQARGEHRRGDADRDVHEQDPLPAGPLGEHAAEEDADGAAGAGDRAPDAHRLVALSALGEQDGDERQRGRGEQRGAKALHGAGRDQPTLALSEAAGKRSDGEEDETGDEQPATTEQVGQTTAEEQEPAEDEHVGVDHPREVVLREVQVPTDRGERDVDDRRVEYDYELGSGEQRHGQPFVGAARGHVGAPGEDVEPKFRFCRTRYGATIPFSSAASHTFIRNRGSATFTS